jgi:membrane-bound serine protease (ClpP class)
MSWGLLTLAGVISIFLGATMLFKSSPAIGGIGVNMKILLINLIGMLVIVFILAYIVLRVHMRKVTTGKEAMLGKRFVLKKPLKLEDKILIEGEWWDCLSMDGEIESGSMVEIVGFDGFKLKLKKVK